MAVLGYTRPPGMQDVARRAGVSHQTVSRVLNGHPNVRPETCDRVRAAIEELGYRRNSAARALVTSRSGTIGVLTLSSDLFGPVLTLISVEEAVREAGLYVSLASLRRFDSQTMAEALNHFMDQAVEGIIVIAPVADVVHAAAELAPQLPVVMVAADTTGGSGFRTAAVDQQAGARLATQHLIELGHTRIAHLAGSPAWLDASARLHGWRQQLAAAGLPASEPWVGDWTADSGYQLGKRMLEGPLPTSVFVANDLMALGLVSAATEAGLSVPRDLSVVGFDDNDGAGFYQPPLTTVRQDFAALGRSCVRLLLAELSGEGGGGDALPIMPELVVRESTSAPGVERDHRGSRRNG